MFYTSNEIDRINTGESVCGDILMIEDNIIIPYSNVVINHKGFDKIFNVNINSYLDFCYIIFKNIDFISFDYDCKNQVKDKQIECYSGVHFLNDKYCEFWISYKDVKIILRKDCIFSKMPFPFSTEKSKTILSDNPAYRDLLKL